MVALSDDVFHPTVPELDTAAACERLGEPLPSSCFFQTSLEPGPETLRVPLASGSLGFGPTSVPLFIPTRYSPFSPPRC